MNIVDVLIILMILFGGVAGWKKGFTREVVAFLGVIAVLVISFLLKNNVSILLYEHLPFFQFDGILKGVTTVNILIYEVLAIVIVMSILMIVLKIITLFTNVFETLLKFTVILGIPSKILGMLVGFVEGFVWVFVILYILSLPVFNVEILNESKYKDNILTKTPILSTLADDTVKVVEEFTELKEEYNNEAITVDEFNYKMVDVFLKYNVVTIESVEKLKEKGKLNFEGLDTLIKEHKGE